MSKAGEAVAQGEAMDVAVDDVVLQDGKVAQPAAVPIVVSAPTDAMADRALTLDEVRTTSLLAICGVAFSSLTDKGPAQNITLATL